jgi:hypothetical protein
MIYEHVAERLCMKETFTFLYISSSSSGFSWSALIVDSRCLSWVASVLVRPFGRSPRGFCAASCIVKYSSLFMQSFTQCFKTDSMDSCLRRRLMRICV